MFNGEERISVHGTQQQFSSVHPRVLYLIGHYYDYLRAYPLTTVCSLIHR